MPREKFWKRLKRLLSAPRIDDQASVDGAGAPLTPTDRQLLEELRGEVHRLQFEWADVLDKINRWASRQAARQRSEVTRALEGADAPAAAAEAPPATNNVAELKAQLRRQAFGNRIGRLG